MQPVESDNYSSLFLYFFGQPLNETSNASSELLKDISSDVWELRGTSLMTLMNQTSQIGPSLTCHFHRVAFTVVRLPSSYLTYFEPVKLIFK